MLNQIEIDKYYNPAVNIVRETNTATVSRLQREMRIGYMLSVRLLDEMEANGVVSAPDPDNHMLRRVLP